MIQLAQTPSMYASSADGPLVDNFHVQLKTLHLHRPIPAPEPNPEPNPGPDSIQRAPGGYVSAADWDALFHAITLRLENCVSDALRKLTTAPSDATPDLLKERDKATKTAVLECVDAMKQLHVELQIERQTSPQTWQAEPPQQH